MSIFRGRVWKLPDNVSTDLLAPGFSREMAGITGREKPLSSLDRDKEASRYCMYAIRPEFGVEARPGDIVVGGKNFGCGSSRESAPRNLKALGISAVVVDSVARIFFRNSIGINLPVLIYMGVSDIFNDKEEAEINIVTGEIKNLTTGHAVKATALPESMLKILRAGGYKNLVKEALTKGI